MYFCEIQSSLIRASYISTGDDRIAASKKYLNEIVYTYKVGGVNYSSSRIFIGDKTTYSKEYATYLQERYSKSTKVKVYYDMDDPMNSVLEPGVHMINIMYILIATVLSIGGLLLFFYYF